MDKRNEKGYILVTVLLLMVVLTIVGLAAISTSSLENMLSGNIRLKALNLAQADGATELTTGLIQRVVRNMDAVGYANLNLVPNAAGLANELRSVYFDTDTQDLSYGNLTVDIDYMYKLAQKGCSQEQASGYEGLGKGSSKCMDFFYRINSLSTDMANSEGTVGAIYRYVDSG
jgi:Tfp pilus assembly protein PilX